MMRWQWPLFIVLTFVFDTNVKASNELDELADLGVRLRLPASPEVSPVVKRKKRAALEQAQDTVSETNLEAPTLLRLRNSRLRHSNSMPSLLVLEESERLAHDETPKSTDEPDQTPLPDRVPPSEHRRRLLVLRTRTAPDLNEARSHALDLAMSELLANERNSPLETLLRESSPALQNAIAELHRVPFTYIKRRTRFWHKNMETVTFGVLVQESVRAWLEGDNHSAVEAGRRFLDRLTSVEVSQDMALALSTLKSFILQKAIEAGLGEADADRYARRRLSSFVMFYFFAKAASSIEILPKNPQKRQAHIDWVRKLQRCFAIDVELEDIGDFLNEDEGGVWNQWDQVIDRLTLSGDPNPLFVRRPEAKKE